MNDINKELVQEKNERKRKKMVMIKSEDVYKIIKKFDKQWNRVPNIGFLAGYFDVTKQSIYAKLNILEEEGKIKRLNNNKKYSTRYELIKNKKNS